MSYNVLEYYFEEAPLLLERAAPQMSDEEVTSYLVSLPSRARAIVWADLPTSSGVSIRAFDTAAPSPRAALARWLYRLALDRREQFGEGLTEASWKPLEELEADMREQIQEDWDKFVVRRPYTAARYGTLMTPMIESPRSTKPLQEPA